MSVQEMVADGVEIIVGVSCDPQLGAVLLLGSGGVMVEIYNDVALRRCPSPAPNARDDRRGQGRPAAPGLSRTAGGGYRRARGHPGARVTLAMHMEGHLADWTSIRSWCCRQARA